MKSQLFDIRREYKKGRLTPGNLNDNPFEQGTDIHIYTGKS